MADATPTTPDARSESYYTAGQYALIRQRFLREPLAVCAGIVLILIILLGFFAGFMSPYAPTAAGADREYIDGPPQIPSIVDAETGEWDWPHLCTFRQERNEFLRMVQVEDCSQKRFIEWFVEGWEYDLIDINLGLFRIHLTSTTHLFGIDEGSIHLFGTDDAGKDIFSRTMHAIWVSLSVGFLGLVLKFVMSLLVGGVAGYFGGRIDAILMTITDAVRVIPQIPIYLALAAMMPAAWSSETRYFAIACIIGFFDFPTLARRLRTFLLSERNQDYVLAARLAGASSGRIIFRHLIPAFASYIIIDTVINFPYMILAETSLSFLGLGLRDPVNSIGVLLSEVRSFEVQQSKLWYFIPVGFFVTMILAFVLVGDGMRDAADPYSEQNK